MIWANNRRMGGALLGNWMAAALVFWLASRVLTDGRTMRRVMSALFVSAGIVSSIGILQFVFGLKWLPQSHPPAGTLMNKNLAAELVVMALPLSLVAYRAVRRFAGRVAVIGTAALMLAYLFVAYSRAAWFALAVQAALLAFVTARSWKRRVFRPRFLMITIAGAVSLLVLISQSRVVHPSLGVSPYRHLRASFEAAMGGGRSETGVLADASALSVRTRLAVWRNTVEMITDHSLLGVGIGNHPVIYPRYARSAVRDPMFGETRQLNRVHNEPLQILAELGLPGLLIAAWLAFGCWRLAVAGLLGNDSRRFGAACAIALAGLTVTSTFGFPLQMPASLLVAAVIVSSLQTNQGLERAEREIRAEHARIMRIVMGVVVVLGLAIAAPRHAYRTAADRHVLRAIKALNENDFRQAEEEAARALSLDPRRKEALFAHGTAALHRGLPLTARAVLDGVVQDYPFDLTAIGNLAAAYAESGDWNHAVTLYGRVVELAPEDAAARHNLALALEQTGRMLQALDEHRQAARFESNQTTYRLRYAVATMRLGRIDDAVRTLRETLEEQPDSAMAHKMLGVLLFEHLGQKDEGRRHLGRALDLDPGISDAERMRQLLRM